MSPMPPTSLTQVAELTEARIGKMFTDERQRWAKVDSRLVEAIDELSDLTQNGGKRLRAAFCYWAYVASDPDLDTEIAIGAAAACELLQTFALIHDDIMDNSETRRGRTTIHAKHTRRVGEKGWRGEPRRYGEGVAILVGDLSHVYADRLLGNVSPHSRSIWDELRIELNLGQYLDMRSSAASDSDRETANQVLVFKSALYTIVRPLQLGASLAGQTDPSVQSSLEKFGRPVGTAFQLRDDLLGLLGDEVHLGKPVGSDLREGKSTELLAIALEKGNQSQLKKLELVGNPDLTDNQVAELVEVLVETGAVSAVEARIKQLITHAEKMSLALPYTKEHRQTLVELGQYVAERTY